MLCYVKISITSSVCSSVQRAFHSALVTLQSRFYPEPAAGVTYVIHSCSFFALDGLLVERVFVEESRYLRGCFI